MWMEMASNLLVIRRDANIRALNLLRKHTTYYILLPTWIMSGWSSVFSVTFYSFAWIMFVLYRPKKIFSDNCQQPDKINTQYILVYSLSITTTHDHFSNLHLWMQIVMQISATSMRWEWDDVCMLFASYIVLFAIISVLYYSELATAILCGIQFKHPVTSYICGCWW